LKKFGINDYVSTALILLVLTVFIHTTSIFSRVDNLLYDLGQKLHRQTAPSDVIIVGVDEESLSRIGRWPWSRKVHADLIKRLKQEGASVIGLDIIFSEPDLQDRSADSILSDAIREAGNVVLPVLIESVRTNGQVIETLPLPAYAENAADIGRVHVVLDEDGIARSIYLYEGIGEPVWQHFAQAILNVAQHQPSKNKFSDKLPDENAANVISLIRKDQRKINFLGAAGHFPTISYAQVINGEFEKDIFKNKIVLVGGTALGLGDQFPTSVSESSQLMPGVEFHANALESIRHNNLITTVSDWVALPILALIALLPLFWLPRLPALLGLLFTLFAFVAISLIAVIMPQLAGVWMPPSAALSAILLSYPVWSWRKLEATRKYLDNEFNYLKQNLIELPGAKKTKNYDSFNARIEQVRAASEQLRFLQNDRKEVLAFISHDLRAPIANALMILEETEDQDHRLYASLSQAHALAEDFLQASRAEMIDSANFKEIDYASLTHQAVDDAYESALKKNITLERDIVDGAVWVHGNFGLLQRAALNLILNAVKFSPADSVVKIRLTVSGYHAVMSVINTGAGISKEKQLFLFKRFSRVVANETAAEGAGLGLYFVQTVAEKHHGYTEVESDVGNDTCFSLRLPVIGFEPHNNAE
jgi:CHASE2 domain-containing sensor protein